MNITNYSKTEAIASLQSLIQGWLDENPKRNRLALARESGVGETTVRRIMNDGSLPSGHNILKLVSYVKGVSTTKDIIKSGGPTLSKVMECHLPFAKLETDQNRINLSASIESSLNSAAKRLIFTKVGASQGVTADEINFEFGQLGLLEAKELVSMGLFLLEADRYRVVDQFKDYSLSPELSKKVMVETTTMYFKPELENNYSFNITEGVSKEAYDEVMDILREAHQRISKKVVEKPGEIPLFVFGIMDTLKTISYNQKENE